MSELIRYRYNTMADETPGGAWKWRVHSNYPVQSGVTATAGGST